MLQYLHIVTYAMSHNEEKRVIGQEQTQLKVYILWSARYFAYNTCLMLRLTSVYIRRSTITNTAYQESWCLLSNLTLNTLQEQ